jgi:chromosome partitioning protein
MRQIIAITNQKGGVGKSTTAQALGAGYILKGFKVLFIDLDPQGNLSYTLGGKTSDYSILEVLNKQGTTLQAIQRTEGGGDLIPSSPSLSGSDIQLSQTGKEYKLSEAIAPIKGRYDSIIIDTPPSLGILTVNALTACTWAIIPAQADTYSLQGIGQLYNTISTVGQYCNPSLIIKGILLTRHNNRIILSRDMQDMIGEIAKNLGTRLFTTTIRKNVAVKEAQAYRKDIFTYAPKSNASKDYQDLIEEMEGTK